MYSGPNLENPTATVNDNDNHIFMLIRNIGASGLRDPFTPPKAWTDLPKVKSEAWDEMFDEQCTPTILAKLQHKEDTEIWSHLGPAKLLTEAEAEKLAPEALWYAGVRNKFPQQLKSARLAAQGLPDKAKAAPMSPFGIALAQNG